MQPRSYTWSSSRFSSILQRFHRLIIYTRIFTNLTFAIWGLYTRQQRAILMTRPHLCIILIFIDRFMIANSYRGLNWLLNWIYLLDLSGSAIHQILFETTVILIWIYIWKTNTFAVRLTSTLGEISCVEDATNTRRSITILITRILRAISSLWWHNRFQNIWSSRIIFASIRTISCSLHLWHTFRWLIGTCTCCILLRLSQSARLRYHFYSVNRIASATGLDSYNIWLSLSLMSFWNGKLKLFIDLCFFTGFLNKAFQ